MAMFLKHREKGTRYRIVKLDPKDAKDRKVTLQGAHGQFVEPFGVERFKKMGYELVQEEV